MFVCVNTLWPFIEDSRLMSNLFMKEEFLEALEIPWPLLYKEPGTGNDETCSEKREQLLIEDLKI